MKLWELSGAVARAANDNPALRTIVINEMRAVAPVFEFAEFYSMTGNADTPRKAISVPGGTTRALDADYTGVVGTPTFGAVALHIYGDKIKTDIAHERRGQDVNSETVRQVIDFSQGIGRLVQDHFINGNAATPNQFSGLITLMAAGQIIKFHGDNGGQVHLGWGADNAYVAEQEELLYNLDVLVADVISGPQFLLMAPKTISYLKSVARQHISTVSLVGALSGNFDAYNGIPIINAGYKSDGTTLVIGYAETLGTSTDCTSVYAVRFGDKANVAFATNVGIQVKDLGIIAAQYNTLVDFDIDMVILNAKAAWRLAGIRLA